MGFRIQPLLMCGAIALGVLGCNEIEGIRAGNLTGPGGASTTVSSGTAGAGADTSATMGGGGEMTTTTSTGGSTTTSEAGSGGSGGSMTTTTTGDGMGIECNYPAISNCDSGQVCCLDKTDPYMDVCGAPGTCGPASEYSQIICASNSDCAAGSCCLYVVNNGTTTEATSYCAVQCNAANNELVACNSAAECINAFPFTDCKSVLGYPSYKFCQMP